MVNNAGVSVVTIIAVSLLLGQHAPGLLAEHELPFATISKGTNGGNQEQKIVIRHEADSTFIELHMGEKPTGGFSIEVARAKEFPDRIIIIVKRDYPGTCPVTQALTQPFHIIRIPKAAKPIIFEYADKTAVC